MADVVTMVSSEFRWSNLSHAIAVKWNRSRPEALDQLPIFHRPVDISSDWIDDSRIAPEAAYLWLLRTVRILRSRCVGSTCVGKTA